MDEKDLDFSRLSDEQFEALLNGDLDDILSMDMDALLGEKTPEPPKAAEPAAPPASAPAEKPASGKEKPGTQKSILLYLHDLVYLLSAIILVFLLLFRVVVVSGTSMNNTLLDGDYLLLIGNTFYHNPQYGDIIVASKDSFDDGAPIVKRVIATEGQLVDIDFASGVVYVDGQALDEPYTLTATNIQEGVSFPLIVDEGCLFVMGDNRNGSKDSRNPEIGLIDKREVLGKVIFLFLPGTNGTDMFGNPVQSRDFSRIGVVS
ncbi:MAG: signal peptidase I [Firmicutes bacterium]|nr:signal peptidase I [Bacillota bacterium]